MYTVRQSSVSPVWPCSRNLRDIPTPSFQGASSQRLRSCRSPRNNEAWAAPTASFAYSRGLANGLRRGFGTQCCHLRARVCASVTAAVAVAVAVAMGGGPGGAQPRGDRPWLRLPLHVAPACRGQTSRPPAPASRSRDVCGRAEEAVPQSQPGREAYWNEGGGPEPAAPGGSQAFGAQAL